MIDCKNDFSGIHCLKVLATFVVFFHKLHLMAAFAHICYLQYVTARCGQLKRHKGVYETTTSTPSTTLVKKINLYFTYESRDTLKSFARLNPEQSDKFVIKI